MNQAHVLVNYESGCEVLGAFTLKSLVEEYVACLCGDEREFVEADGEQCTCHELAVWTVALDDPSFIQDFKGSRENSDLNHVHVLSNSYGEILGAFTDKVLLHEDKCQHCESYESRAEICPYRKMLIDTVPLDNPSLIEHFKERIAQVRDGIPSSDPQQVPIEVPQTWREVDQQ